jgi:hypothetical protein
MKIVQSDDLGGIVCEALGLENKGVSRIIIDMEVAMPLMVYVEMLASPKVLELDWTKLKGATVNVLDKEDVG